MDGVHDLGGMQGFGPVDVDHGGHVQMAEWESRMWAISRTTGAPDWTIDWWRHIIERLPPDVYLTIPYFEKWMLTYSTGFITSNIVIAEEVVSGHAAQPALTPAEFSLADVLDQLRNGASSTREEISDPPRFKVGETVTTVVDVPVNHTRLPRYARGRRGEIIAHRGAYILADLNAHGIQKHEHHYTVAFAAQELWGPAASARDTVRLDLWESYFVQT